MARLEAHFGMSIATINPATGELIRSFKPLDSNEIEVRLARSAEAFRTHRRSSFKDRAARLKRLADEFETRAQELAELMALEMGKPVRAGRDEALKCGRCCRFFAENAERFLAEETRAANDARSSVRYQPLGAILAVMPWNFPFWQVIRFAAPALMAGNVALLKHASNVPQCALALESLFNQAGFGSGVFQTLLIGSEPVARLIQDRRVAAITLTGSEAAGSSVAAAAAGVIKKAVLELGGSDPFIVMPTADLDRATATAVKARCVNSGQSCIAAKRFIIHAAVYEEFERRFTSAMRALRVGDPFDETTEIGPLATRQVIDSVEDQVKRAIGDGARLLLGGRRLPRPGNFHEPTVLAEIPSSCTVRREEVFGPVAMLFRVADIGEAIDVANETTFGLGASAWTSDAAEQARFIDELEAGQVFINGMVASDPGLPFGGIKSSGYGRELGREGILEFVNVKTVSMAGS
jgi:succinate-semialdehyde dehydrogenase/glutarate-semialdehyde dehydrogenase